MKTKTFWRRGSLLFLLLGVTLAHAASAQLVRLQRYSVGHVVFDDDPFGEIDSEPSRIIGNINECPIPEICLLDLADPILNDEYILNDDRAALAFKRAVDSILCSAGSRLAGEPRFPTILLGDTTVLILADLETEGEINSLSVSTNDPDLLIHSGTRRAPALFIDFDPTGFDDDDRVTAAEGDAAVVTARSDFSRIRQRVGLGQGNLPTDSETANLVLNALVGEMSLQVQRTFSGLVVATDATGNFMFNGAARIIDKTGNAKNSPMAAAGCVPPLVDGISPDIIPFDFDEDHRPILTIRGYNMLNPAIDPNDPNAPTSMDPPFPCLEIGGLLIRDPNVPNDPNDPNCSEGTDLMLNIERFNRYTLRVRAPTVDELRAANNGVFNPGDSVDVAVVTAWGQHRVFNQITYENGLSCRLSMVNARGMSTDPNSPFALNRDVLFVNDSSGDSRNCVFVDTRQPIKVSIGLPPSLTDGSSGGGNALYSIYAIPFIGQLQPTPQPGSLGMACFPTPLDSFPTRNQMRIFNITQADIFGPSVPRRCPVVPLQPAGSGGVDPENGAMPGTIVDLRRGFRRPIKILFQGFIQDTSAEMEPLLDDERYSLTNAVILNVVLAP